MSHIIVIRKMAVQNANAIAGLTYGFPAITHFLGFAHALSRQLPVELGVSLGGVGVVCHGHQVHAKQPKGWGDYVFSLSRNPLTKEGNTAPIVEEGRMNFVASLVIEVNGMVEGDDKTATQLVEYLDHKTPSMRCAGGQVINLPKSEFVSCYDNQQLNKLMRSLMPGFALVDRKEYLVEHYQDTRALQPEFTLFDAWCDFAALKYRAEKVENQEKNETTQAHWKYVSKPHSSGYLVPVMVGYCAISEVYSAGEVENVRDNTVPAVFAEAAYSVAEWLSPHRIKEDLTGLIWRYKHQAPWYIATSKKLPELDDTETDYEPY